MEYEIAKETIINKLKIDADLQDKGNFEKMGEDYDEIDAVFPRSYHQLAIAWTFWDAWVDEKNHNFPGFYRGIAKETWPKLARHIIDHLSQGYEISDPLILSHFDFKKKPSLLRKLGRDL